VSFWIPVDPIAQEHSLRFMAGSHLYRQMYTPRTFLTGEARWWPEGTLPELSELLEADPPPSILQWGLEPGDAVAFHMLTVHSAGGAGQAHRRRAYSIRVVGDDARHAVRPWTTSPPFPGLADELADGAPFDHPLHPVIWPRPSAAHL
jgi:ectoine hydroxylase-related dioxygenase (phytanoyl-CoA dioxygenase family)